MYYGNCITEYRKPLNAKRSTLIPLIRNACNHLSSSYGKRSSVYFLIRLSKRRIATVTSFPDPSYPEARRSAKFNSTTNNIHSTMLSTMSYL